MGKRGEDMGQDLCPGGEVKAGRSLIWGCPVTDRTTDTGGASEVWRRGKQLACGRRTETTQTAEATALCTQTGTSPHQCAQGLTAGTWRQESKAGERTAVGSEETA